jgi:Tfp pilus assembly protein PilO
MTGRDRIVVMVIAVLAILGAGWMLVVSPERKTADQQSTQLAAAQATLASAEGSLSGARAAQSQYAAAYASVVSLGKAVPPGQEVSSLIYELSQATSSKHVDFASIVTGSGTSGSPGLPGATTAAASTVAAGFTQMPFTFVFNGGFFDLEHLFQQLDHLTTRSVTGSLEVSGRLLTIQSVKLAPMAEAKGANGGLSGTITATAYELPGGQGIAGSATPSSPTGASAPAASSGTGASSPTAPAIARVTP